MFTGRRRTLCRSWTILGLFLIAAMVLSACVAVAPQPAPAPVEAPQAAEPTVAPEKPAGKTVYGGLPREDTLILAGTASNEVWDTFTSMSGPLTNAYNGYEQLAVEHPFLQSAGKLYPYLAQKWEYNQDGTEMTIFLTPGATWNDGKPVTIDDWTFTLDYLTANKDKGVPYGNLLDNVKYRTEGNDKIVFSFFDQDGKPVSSWRFHQNFLNNAWRPLPKHIWEGQDPMTFKNNPPVEAGPYNLVNCNADTKTCIWERREDYWKKDEPLAAKYVVFTRQPEPDLLAREMAAGAYDISQLPYKQVLEVMKENPNIITLKWPSPCPQVMMYNVERPPLNDRALRHAISLLIDRESAAKLDPASRPSFVPWPHKEKPEPKFYDQADMDKNDYGVFDPAKAAQILDEAGYKLVDGKRVDKDGKPISLSVMTFDPSIHGAAAAGFAKMLSEEAAKLGLEINVNTAEVGTYFDSAAKGNFDLMYGWLCADPEDPWGDYDALHSKHYMPIGESAPYGNNMRYKNPELDALVDKVLQTSPTDPAIQDLYKQLFRIVAEDKPYIPLFMPDFIVGWNAEYFKPAYEVEPWYWFHQTRGLLRSLEKVQK